MVSNTTTTKQKQFNTPSSSFTKESKEEDGFAFVVKEMMGKNWMLFFFSRMRHKKRGMEDDDERFDRRHTRTHYIYIYMTSRLV